jgi:hypothetical protein
MMNNQTKCGPTIHCQWTTPDPMITHDRTQKAEDYPSLSLVAGTKSTDQLEDR